MATIVVPITNLKGLLGLPNHQEIQSYETDYLTSVFDNYGSLMLSLKVNILDKKKGQEDILNLVCKLYPLDEHWQDMFQIDRTFEKEAKLYMDVVPELQLLQGELNIPKEDQLDVFVKCYGARLAETKAGKRIEAAMVMENIKLQGYKVGERSKGFDREHVDLVIKKLAHFHALPMVLRSRKTKVFQEKIMPAIKKVNLNDGLQETELKDMKLMFQDYFLSIPEIRPLNDRILKQIDYCWKLQDKSTPKENLFNTICHNDFWVNNMMIKYEEGKAESLKIYDFQLTKYEPGITDLIFFLFTSVNYDLLSESFDELVKQYYKELIRVLEIHSFAVDQHTYESFLDTLNQVAVSELYHLLVMLRVLHMDKSKLPKEEEHSSDMIFRPEVVGEDYYRKLKLFISEYERRGWLME